MSRKLHSTGFSGLGIAPGLLGAVARLGFAQPTPIQRSSIPVGLEGKDVIAIAQTGTGKTLAFGIPMLQRLAKLKGQGLVLLPTRELALQVSESLLAVGKSQGLRTAVVIGGEPEGPQQRALSKNPLVIVATPGRLVDFLQRKILSLKDVRVLVLDEADRMLDMGFAPDLKKIIGQITSDHQTMLYSATMPKAILNLAHQHMKLPINIEVAPSGTAAENLTQEVFFIERPKKVQLLEVLLDQYHGSVLVFTRTKYGARNLARNLRRSDFTAAEIHSDRSQNQRREALEGFKTGKYRILVATDIAARGIDVVGIELVVNYDLPTNTEDYVHRIGRTARAGLAGRAISFATFDQKKDVHAIERLIKTGLAIKEVPQLKPKRISSRPGKPDKTDKTDRSSAPKGGTTQSDKPKKSRRPKPSGKSRKSSSSKKSRRKGVTPAKKGPNHWYHD